MKLLRIIADGLPLFKEKACICEGSAENAIMDILLDHDLLIFTREEMLGESTKWMQYFKFSSKSYL